MTEKVETTDEYLSNIDEVFDMMEGEQEEESLTDRISKYDLRIEEYLHFVFYALYIVESSMALKINRQHIDEFFIDFYLKRENSYKKSEDFVSELIFGSILPIFESAVFIDTDKTKEWERNNEIDIKKSGMPSGNGYAQEYYDKNKIVEYQSKSLLKIFSDEEIYEKLRKKCIAPIADLPKKEKQTEERTKEDRNNNKKRTLYQFFKEDILDFASKITEKESLLNADMSYILNICKNEIKYFLDYLLDNKKVSEYNSLTDKEKIILRTFRLYNDGFRDIPISNITRTIAIEYGGAEETYRKILKQIINDGFDIEKLENIKELTSVLKRGVGISAIDIADKKYKRIQSRLIFRTDKR